MGRAGAKCEIVEHIDSIEMICHDESCRHVVVVQPRVSTFVGFSLIQSITLSVLARQCIDECRRISCESADADVSSLLATATALAFLEGN